MIVTGRSVTPAGRRISDPSGPRTLPPAAPTAVVPSGATYSVRSIVVAFPWGSVTVTQSRSSIEARSSASTAVIFYVLSRDVAMSLGGGFLDGVVKIGMYFLHERIWNHIDYGRPKPPEYEI